MYKVVEVNQRGEWDAFVKKQQYSPFVQAPAYGTFFESLGEESWIFGVYKDDTLVGGSLVVSTHARRGDFLYLPYGPVVSQEVDSEGEVFKSLLEHIFSFARNESYHFVRVSPFMSKCSQTAIFFEELGMRPAPIHVLAENTWLLSLDKSEDELLASMKKNHRNLIRRCERDGVVVKNVRDVRRMDQFHAMHDTVAERHKFSRFSRSYIEKEFLAYAKDSDVLMFEAYLPNGVIDSSAIIFFYGNVAVYRHSSSLNQNRKLPTSYAIQWEVIKEARRRGMKYYNFWGVAPEGVKDHPFSGITHFKKGFGGFQHDLVPCYDKPISFRYWPNWIIETVRRIKRGF